MKMINARTVEATQAAGTISCSAICIGSASVAVATASLINREGESFSVSLIRGMPVYVDFIGIGGSLPAGGFTIGTAADSSF